MLGGDFPKVAVSPVRRPGSIRAQLITAAAASAQRIQDFGSEVGCRARRLWPRLGGVDLTGNLSARPAERDVRGPGGVPGIQLLLADTEDATTGETVTNWPGSPHNHHLPHSIVS